MRASRPSSADSRVEGPPVRNALEVELVAILEADFGAGDPVAYGAGDEHLAGAGERRHAVADVHGDPCDCVRSPGDLASMSPDRVSSPTRRTSSRMCWAQRIARAGPSNVASSPSPAERSSDANARVPASRRGARRVPTTRRSQADPRATDRERAPSCRCPSSPRCTSCRSPGREGACLRVVLGACAAGEAVQQHQGRDALGMRGSCGHHRHLRRVAVRDEGRSLRPLVVHHGDEVIHPPLDGRVADHGRGHADPAHVEPEHAREPRERPEERLEQRLLDQRLEVGPPVV